MRRILVPLVLCLALAGGGCWFTTQSATTGKTGAETISDVAVAVAPALPGPLGGIVAGGAALLTLVGGIFAKRKVEAVRASVPDPEMGAAKVAALNPVVKMLAERKWLMPIIAGLINAGAAANLWHIDPTTLITLTAGLGAPSVGEFVKDGLANSSK
jgi:hypothetical protein